MGVQALSLRSQGWRPDLGTFPEAIAAIGTVGALFVAIGVWRHEVGVRRVDEQEAREVKRQAELAARAARGDQARLVVFDFLYDVEHEMRTGGERSVMRAIVKNLSSRPIFDVRIEVPEQNAEMRLIEDDEPSNVPNSAHAKAIDAHGEHKAYYEHIARRIDWPWLNEREVTFTDANGVRWTRTPLGQPREVV